MNACTAPVPTYRDSATPSPTAPPVHACLLSHSWTRMHRNAHSCPRAAGHSPAQWLTPLPVLRLPMEQAPSTLSLLCPSPGRPQPASGTQGHPVVPLPPCLPVSPCLSPTALQATHPHTIPLLPEIQGRASQGPEHHMGFICRGRLGERRGSMLSREHRPSTCVAEKGQRE